MDWKKYLIEFISIFVAVTMAFALNKWNEDRRDKNSELKILTEIKNGLEMDLVDLNTNLGGHEFGIFAGNYFRKYINEEPVNNDTLLIANFVLLRDFLSIQNKTGYESLKSSGLQLIENDSLRVDIISLYDFNYEILERLESEYVEMQFFDNYFDPINSILADRYVFDKEGKIAQITSSKGLAKTDKNKLLYYLKNIEENRNFMIIKYKETIEQTKSLIRKIEKELEQH